MRQRYNEAPKKPNFIFQVTDLQQEKIIIEKSGENRCEKFCGGVHNR
jgi:hypothetical protein